MILSAEGNEFINQEDYFISNYQWGNEVNTESNPVIPYFLLNRKMNLCDSPEFA